MWPPPVLYHTTKRSLVPQILERGLRPGYEFTGFTGAGEWAYELYGQWPIFLHAGSYRESLDLEVLTVDTAYLDLDAYVVDFPSLVDLGMLVTPYGDGFVGLFENTPSSLKKYEDENGDIFLLDISARDGFAATNTVGYLRFIPAIAIQTRERRHSSMRAKTFTPWEIPSMVFSINAERRFDSTTRTTNIVGNSRIIPALWRVRHLLDRMNYLDLEDFAEDVANPKKLDKELSRLKSYLR